MIWPSVVQRRFNLNFPSCLRLLCGFLMLVALETFAARPTFQVDPNYLIDTWETEDGLPENSATAMVQTSDGYLWFGTFSGLVRFDGVKFTTFDPANTPELPSAGIVNLHLDRRGWLWVSTYSGLVVREGTRWRALGTNDGWAGNYVRTFAERTNGDLLITTFDGHVLEFSHNRLSSLPAPPGEKEQGYLAHVDEAGQWWVVQNHFIGRFDGVKWMPMVTLGNLGSDAVGCGRARDGGWWLLVGRELRKYREGSEVSRLQLPQQPGGFWDLFEDSRSNVWICTYDKGLCEVAPNGGVRRWTTTNVLAADGVRFAFEDAENDVWIGTSGGGLTRFKPRRVRSFGRESGLAAGANSVCSDANGGIWAGTYGGGLYRGNDTGIANVSLAAISNAATYLHSVLMDRAGRVWLGTSGNGLWLGEQQSFRPIPPERTGGNNVVALFEDSRGRVWISGGGGGISVFDGKDFRCYREEQGVPRRAVFCFAEDSQGDIWFSDLAAVFRLEQQRFVELRTPEDKALKGITFLKADPDGAVWMGSLDQGLLRWRQGKWTTLDQQCHLPRAALTSVIEDRDGFWWLPSDLGIIRLSGTNLQAVADGKARNLVWQALDRSDGLASLAFAANRQPVCARDARGRLWFATGKGLAMIDPKEFRLNTVPPAVHIERMVYRLPARARESGVGRSGAEAAEVQFSLEAPFTPDLRLPPGSHRLEIYYTANSFSAPEKIRFQSKMEGKDADWHDMAGQRVAQFYELAPATYAFRVRAANNDGVWNEQGAGLSFTLLPFFWQTAWFRVGAALAFVNTGGVVVWWLSRRKHRRQLLQLERERRHAAELAHVGRVSTLGELSGSLAHELNQPLGIILSNAQAAQRLLAQDPPDLAEVRDILADVVAADRRAGDVIQRLRSMLKGGDISFQPQSINDIIEEVLHLANSDLIGRGVVVVRDLAPDLPRAIGDRVQIEQLLLNLIINAADAMVDNAPGTRHLHLKTASHGDAVRVTVRDEGVGLPKDTERLFQPFFTTKPHGLGMGLAICRSITTAHHGRLWAESHPDCGALFHLELPVAEQVPGFGLQDSGGMK